MSVFLKSFDGCPGVPGRHTEPLLRACRSASRRYGRCHGADDEPGAGRVIAPRRAHRGRPRRSAGDSGRLSACRPRPAFVVGLDSSPGPPDRGPRVDPLRVGSASSRGEGIPVGSPVVRAHRGGFGAGSRGGHREQGQPRATPLSGCVLGTAPLGHTEPPSSASGTWANSLCTKGPAAGRASRPASKEWSGPLPRAAITIKAACTRQATTSSGSGRKPLRPPRQTECGSTDRSRRLCCEVPPTGTGARRHAV